MQKYMVVQPGKGVREFDRAEDAVKHLVEHVGFAKLYAPDGNLIMTKGTPPTDA
jgi:prophage tail gpP-like protein